jgi:hypothetical protein
MNNNVNDATEEYYRLKNKYETDLDNNKRKLLNNGSLSIKEKRREYLKLKPKCVHCKRAGGTVFSLKYSHPDDKFEFRELKATCGIIADPCNLNITIQLGVYHLLPNLLKEESAIIIETKETIIDNKNKLLFGFISTDDAIEEFEGDKELINYTTSLYEQYLNKVIIITENPVKKAELKEKIEKSYVIIDQIKECVAKFDETNNKTFIKDSVEIYNNLLKPLLLDIRKLKYKEYYVDYDEKLNVYHLVQKTSSIQSLEQSNHKSVVIEYNVKPYNSNKKAPIAVKPKEKRILIESDTEDEDDIDTV